MINDYELEYWRDCLLEAADECGLVLTDEQLACLAKAMALGRECYGSSVYQPPSPYPDEIEKLKGELRKERSKIACPECHGDGRLRYNTGSWAVNTGCHVCHGEGKVLP